MTLSKLAQLAGCSVSTVSKAFHDSPEISEETRKKIFDIAKKNNCFTKYYTPTLGKHVFAAICTEISSPYYAAIIESLDKKISDNGDMLLIASSKFVVSNFAELIDYYVNFHRIDGLILIHTPTYATEYFKKIPTVKIGKETNKILYCDCVNSIHDNGIYESISYLKNMGHTKIAYIGEYFTTSTLDTFKDALIKNNLEINNDWLITSSKRKSEAGYDGMDKLISLSSRPTAVFAAYDTIAFGAIRRVYDMNLNVPNDFSIISKDDIPLAEYSSPALTTIAMPIEEMTETALNLLYKRLKYSAAPYKKVSIQSSLVIRDSVKKPKNI
ncbi:MAG: LacI family DNA-binding transcriptional regulator [Clostridiales bacterium]|nr:LacI family DNA-binding transcriptional regulator [Clostridiales bacterium]